MGHFDCFYAVEPFNERRYEVRCKFKFEITKPCLFVSGNETLAHTVYLNLNHWLERNNLKDKTITPNQLIKRKMEIGV